MKTNMAEDRAVVIRFFSSSFLLRFLPLLLFSFSSFLSSSYFSSPSLFLFLLLFCQRLLFFFIFFLFPSSVSVSSSSPFPSFFAKGLPSGKTSSKVQTPDSATLACLKLTPTWFLVFGDCLAREAFVAGEGVSGGGRGWFPGAGAGREGKGSGGGGKEGRKGGNKEREGKEDKKEGKGGSKVA